MTRIPFGQRREPFDVKGHEDDDDAQTPCVPYVPFSCPFCGRHKPITSGPQGGGRLRYHKCQACGRRYRSWQLTAADVPDWTPPPEARVE